VELRTAPHQPQAATSMRPVRKTLRNSDYSVVKILISRRNPQKLRRNPLKERDLTIGQLDDLTIGQLDDLTI
jgi:hypothetical protein